MALQVPPLRRLVDQRNALAQQNAQLMSEVQKLKYRRPLDPNFEREKQAKLDRIGPLLKSVYRSRRTSYYYDCMTAESASSAGIKETENVSSNAYIPEFEKTVLANPETLFVDVGAGYRDKYYPNVVNVEVVAYQSTDVLSTGENLPFETGVIDFVYSSAVLEHVRDPFRCAAEIIRVLKPGGTVWAAVPFLSPYHGYPDHYYNMSPSGLKNLFEPSCDIVSVTVPAFFHPIYVLEWIVRQYTWRLSEADKKQFLSMKLGDIDAVSKDPSRYGFAANLPLESQLELCLGSLCIAKKK